MQAINTSRAAIENRLIQELQAILETEGVSLDNRESAFNTYMIRALAHELANQLLYGTIISRESSLVTAILPETVKNWAKYIGYHYRLAQPASTDLLVSIPLMGEFSGRFKRGFKFYADSIIFTSKYLVTFSFVDSLFRVQYLDESNLVKSLPYYVTYQDSVPYANFLIPIQQVEVENFEFTIDSLMPQEFFEKTLTLKEGYQLADIEVFDDEGNFYTVVDNIFSATSEEYVVLVEPYLNKIQLVFGNGVFGKAPNKHIKVNAYITLGAKGNVLAGTINKGDTLYTDSNPPMVISYSVINTENVTNGVDEETIEEIKQSAPLSLSALNRIVSKTDFDNASVILRNNAIYQSKSVLKRSDLVTNEICLYSVFRLNNKIIPTTTIPVTVNSNQFVISQDSIITHEGKEYVVLFNITLDRDLKIANYSYTPLNINLDLNQRFTTLEVSPMTTIRIQYNSQDQKYDVYSSISTSSQLDSFNQKLIIFISNRLFEYEPLDSATIDTIKTFHYQVEPSVLLNANRLELNNLLNSQVVEIYDSIIKIDTDISQYAYSYLSEDGNTIYDVPVVDNEYFQSLSENDKLYLREKVISDFIFKANAFDKRLINSNISCKFARTIGKTYNTQYSTPSYIVQKIITNKNEITETGLFYAVTDPVQDNDLYEFAGNLVLFDGSNYKRIDTPTGTIIRNLEDNKIYATDGRRWILPIYDIPITISVEVHTTRTDALLVPEVKTAILSNINKLGLEESLYLSRIIDAVQKVRGVDYVRVIQPKTDIIYRDIIRNIPKEDLKIYTPEYLYTDENHIFVRVMHN